ncbi:MAG: hypothetical protein DSY82_05745 [Flavobacteriia bacterium]|nr:MAG: hypothetical protein DSY82_05745 [Flavobacteriia bacterium]
MYKRTHFFFIFLFAGMIFSFAQQKKYSTYRVGAGENLQKIAEDLNISKAEILRLNPDIQGDVKEGNILVVPNKNFDKKNDIINYDIGVLKGRDIVVDGFIYHEVTPKETLYSITRNYKVSSSSLKNHNPFLFEKGLEIGQTLKIPLPKKIKKVDDRMFKPYVVHPKETKYSISRDFGISIDSLEQLNPSIRNGLKIDDVILVPAKNTSDVKAGFKVHEVKKGETLYSLSKDFGITQEELIAENPELQTGGLKEGMLIKIPEKRMVKERFMFYDEIPERSRLNVTFMLPFKANIDTLDFEKNRLLNAVSDFYFGASIAIDSLKAQGLSLNINVYDTQKSKFVVKKILERNKFDDTHLIIGPMFLDNVKEVATDLNYKPVKIVSPISEKDHSFIMNKNLIQEVPTAEQMASEMLRYVESHYKGDNLLLLTDEKPDTASASIIARIKAKFSGKGMKIIKPHKGYISGEKIRMALDVISSEQDTITKNWVFLVSNDEVITKDVIHNIGVLPENTKVTLFTFNEMKFIDRLDNNNLARSKFHFPSSVYINYNSDRIKQFAAQYKRKFSAYPSKYAFKGFDVTYDSLLRMLNQADLTEQGMSERLETRFDFIENTTGNVINQGIFILKYDGLNIKKVN